MTLEVKMLARNKGGQLVWASAPFDLTFAPLHAPIADRSPERLCQEILNRRGLGFEESGFGRDRRKGRCYVVR